MEIFRNLFNVLLYILLVQDRGSYRGLKKTVQSLQGVVLQWSGSFSAFRKDRLLSSFLYVWMFTSRKMLHSIVQAARFVYNWLPYLSLELLDSFVCVCVGGWVELKRLRPLILYPLNQIKETLTKLVIPYFVKVCISQLTLHNMSGTPGFVIIVSCEASVHMQCESMLLAK
jgi:hypothetical protein